ncbi:MAG: energy transducer TonB [Bacteroidetes bacterium B1(2017)]|nr:MAG: energy transducer TonB [Bacteroidetes bacterium B1(2017)]
MAAKLDIFDSKWVELVFTGRNKAYGAYVLRKKGDEYTIKGIIFAVVLFTASISAPVIVNYIKSQIPKENAVKVTDVTTLEEPPPIDKNEPPPPPTEPPPPLKSTVKFTPPEIKPDEEVPDDEPPPIQEEMKDKDAGVTTVEGDPNGVDASLTEGGEGDGEAPEILTFAEQMPEFAGGTEELYKYLSKNIQYPPLARENSIEGKVVLTFVVGSDGKISQIEQVGKKLGWSCDEEAIRVVKNMPPWTPGKQNGKAVVVKFTLPIRFQLN